MRSDTTHTIERIDVKDRLPRENSYVLVWGHNVEDGFRWIDLLAYENARFVDDDIGCDVTEHVTHWAELTNLNWNDGLPLGRGFCQ